MYALFLIIALSVYSLNGSSSVQHARTIAPSISPATKSQVVRDTQTNRLLDYNIRRAALETAYTTANAALDIKKNMPKPRSRQDTLEISEAQKIVQNLRDEIADLDSWFNSLPAH